MQTLEELGDVYNHFLLYYGRDIPKMQNAAKANKKRIKKLKDDSEDGKPDMSVSIDDDETDAAELLSSNWNNFWVWVLIGCSLGEEEELEVEQEEEHKGPDLKLASRRDMYSICQSVGLG